MPGPIVSIDSLTHRYCGRTALDNLSLSVDAGEVFAFLGPNGSGKTTLFRILSTLLRPTSGGVTYWFDRSQFGLESQAEIRRHIGVVFQSPSLDGELTAEENLRHHGHLYNLRGAKLTARIGALLGRLNLADRAGDRVKSFSGGMKRRVEIAKGLLPNPSLLLLDEPSTGLDPGSRIDLWALLGQIRSEGVTILVTTHLMDEADLATRLAIMHQGRLVALGSPGELKSRIGGDVVTLQSPNPAEAARVIRERLGLAPSLVESTVRLEHPDGPRLIPELVAALGPGLVDSVSVGKPTLQDVFIRATGHRLAADLPAGT